MCRLFGFRSVIQSMVHSSLVSADNALELQSSQHPDGWGVSYYVEEAPHLVKSVQSALNDSLFKKVSGLVSSETVLAHIRNATLGNKTILNTHPFQYGHWMFAHNGNIKNFKNHRDKITAKIPPALQRFILGETDSELIFYFILSNLQTKISLSQKNAPVEMVAEAIRESISDLVKICGDYSKIDDAGEDETYFTFILTNGKTMLAHQGGKNLFYSTYKTKCSDRDSCPSYAPMCEAAPTDGQVNHLIFSSEPLEGENIWEALDPGQIIGVDGHMKISLF